MSTFSDMMTPAVANLDYVHGETVVIGGTSYTVRFVDLSQDGEDGQVLRQAKMMATAGVLPASLPEDTEVTRSADSSVWAVVAAPAEHDGEREVDLVGWDYKRDGGLG